MSRLITSTTIKKRPAGLFAVVVFDMLLAACDKGHVVSPTRPTDPSTPNSPSGPTPQRIEVAGPRTLAPGEMGQFSATATYSDGSSRDVTSEADWHTGDTRVLSSARSGLAVGGERGETYIFAEVGGSKGRRGYVYSIIVVPSGTFQMKGKIHESGTPSLPIVGARVEAKSRSTKEISTTTNADGSYALYGVAGEVEVRVSREGYEGVLQSLNVGDHQTRDFTLTLSRPRDDIQGNYTLTITASSACGAKLPADLLVRKYSAVATQQGPNVKVNLAGATFAVRGESGKSFTGELTPGQVVFRLLDASWYLWEAWWPDLVEQLPDSIYLVVDGTAITILSGTGLSGTLHGNLWLFQDRISEKPLAFCYATDHGFVLSK